LELRDKVQKREILGPSLYLAGPSFSGGAVQNPAAAEARVRQQKAEGWDLLKVHPGLSRASYDAMAQTAHELGMRFAGHVPAEVGLLHAIDRRQESIDHVDGYIELLQADSVPVDQVRLAELVKLTRDTGTWVVPTMVLWETIIGAARLAEMLAFSELKYMPRAEVERWRTVYDQRISAPAFNAAKAAQIAANRNAVLKALYEGDVKIAFGTDAPQQYSVPGFSVHREMKSMASVGMSPYAILRSATSRVGEYFAFKDHFGQVNEGHRADLVLLEANPLSDIGNVSKRAGVMVRGRWLPEPELQAGLARIEAAMRQ
jgi:imidazolonepropionase-like amidohydrolase